MTRSTYPELSVQRLRKAAFMRDLIRECKVTTKDLIQPIFLLDGAGQRQPVVAMPGVSRVSTDLALEIAAECVALGIPAVSLHPVLETVLRTADAREAANPDGLMPRAIRALKEKLPGLGIIANVSLTPYILPGHTRVHDLDGKPSAEETLGLLVRQATLFASAGADLLLLSDPADCQVAAVRASLEREGLDHVCVISSPANYASALHGPHGEHSVQAIDSFDLGREPSLLDPANIEEGMREAALAVAEGADILMLKPGLPYLDILYRIKQEFKLPLFAFQASGEYAMLKAAAQNGWVLHDRLMMEWITSFKRAGADAVITFFARDIARQLGRAA